MEAAITCVPEGFGCRLVRIEGGVLRGYSGLSLIGQTNDICRDGKERALAALERCGVKQPALRMVLSMSPAEIKVQGPQVDLAFAVLLARLFDSAYLKRTIGEVVFLAELGLDGSLRAARAFLPLVLSAVQSGIRFIVTDPQSALCLASIHASLFENCSIFSAGHLNDILNWLKGDDCLQHLIFRGGQPTAHRSGPDFSDMVLTGEQRTLAAAIAAGGHHCLLSGPPGCGKSMFATRLPSIQPAMNTEDRLHSMMIHSHHQADLQHFVATDPLPFRAPHHSASMQAMTGSSRGPGEFALAHGGILFMDEMPEFRRDVLEALREPLEAGQIHVSRVDSKNIWPARFTLIGARNPCPCGYFLSQSRLCRCPLKQVQAYRHRLSGPVLDRIDIQFEMPVMEISRAFIDLGRRNETSRDEEVTISLRSKVEQACEFMLARNAKLGFARNSRLDAKAIQAASGLQPPTLASLVRSALPESLSQRAALKVLRVARTLADLDHRTVIEKSDLDMALRWHGDAAAPAYGL